MNPKMIWANLAVSDLERTTKFYTAIGFKSKGKSDELTSFSVGEDEFVINFFLENVLKTNVKIEISNSQKENEIIFTLAAESKDQVDSWSIEVAEAGGKIVSGPEEFGKGYYGFVFADPDGHKYNVFHM